MSLARGIFGATLGAGLAGLALRVRSRAHERGIGSTDIVSQVPELVAEELRRVSAAARVAMQDGRAASARARSEFDEQVGARRRRMEQHDV